MDHQIAHSTRESVWAVAKRQHGVVSRGQLLELGLCADAITHRLAKGRLHSVWRGVYALGRPELSQHGRWMAAVLSCGPEAVLSHSSAADLWEIRSGRGRQLEVSVPLPSQRRRPGILVHRRKALGAAETTTCDHIPVTNPICTLVDIAPGLSRAELEAAVNSADRLGLVNPEALRTALDGMLRLPGVASLRYVLDRRTFTLTDSELERRFLPLARSAGLPLPETGRRVNGFKVDFHWPDLGLVVETDGLRYHRTPAQQARDRLRDQTHAANGLTPLRFTRAQVVFEAEHVATTLSAVAARLAARRGR